LFCALLYSAALITTHDAQAQSPQDSTKSDTTKLIIGEGSSGVGHNPLYIAEIEGFFKKAGLDVEGQILNGGTGAAMAAYANRSINILNLSAPEVIQYTGNKVIQGKAFAELNDGTNDVISAKGITDIKQIKGKAVGVSAMNSGDYILLVSMMQQAGLSPNDVTFITSGNPLNRLAAMDKGAVQLIVQPTMTRDDSARVGNVLVKSADNQLQFPTGLLISSDDFIKAHRPLLQKFVTVLQETIAWMQAHPAEAAADCAKAIGASLDVCTSGNAFNFDRSLSSKYTWSKTLAVNVAGVKTALAAMATMDPKTAGLTVDDVVDTSMTGTTP
jgi:ABC-type nitrate/sulfonate/bicarbonate transport system substrate-binding protein